MSAFPELLRVGGSSIEPHTAETWEEVERDPRGLLLMWSAPRKDAKYVMACDPTQGVTGWSRATRTDGDHKTDNAAIEIFEVEGVKEPLWVMENGKKIEDIDPITKRRRYLYRDVQVAEFAAPCDAVEIARVLKVLGTIYKGDAEDQCELIYEAWPGPGMLTGQELGRIGYQNLWMWEHLDTMGGETTNKVGWYSSRESQKLLWYRARRHLMNRNVLIRSKFLLDEYSNAEIDLDKMRARAAYGYHDDRFMAANLAFWAAHKWTVEVERTEEPVRSTLSDDPQLIAPTLEEEYEGYKHWREQATADWY